jgi:hypothetical protein
MTHRRHLGGQVTDAAYNGWHDFARTNGVSVSALLEVVGVWLGEQDRPVGRLPESWRSIMATARNVTADRRQRS